MEPEPVEDCVQNTLSALYPPFVATAPTLLGQVFEVVERTYREDALRYTIEFLIPAKHILARIQQEACAQYSGFVFYHEGWPLCLHEKVVVQLSSLPWQQLCPGDFYLQVIPYLSRAPRLVLKCLSPDGRSVQELPVLPDAYPFLFTAEWLNGINKDRRAGRLEHCLLAAEERILRLPWTELICPQFVHQGSFMVGRRCLPGPSPEVLGARSPGDGRHSGGESQEAEGGGLEGEYVQLLEISPPRHNAPSTPVSPSSQSRTLPTRKGQGKGRNRRHRAWLHHKPSREETLPRNRPRRTWEGGRPGVDPGQAGLLRGWDLQRPYGETGGLRASQGDGQDRGGPVHKVAAQSQGKEGRLPRERWWGGGTGERARDPTLGDEQQGGDPPEGWRGGDPSLKKEKWGRDSEVKKRDGVPGERQQGGDCSLGEVQRSRDPEEKQRDGVPGERQQGGDCSLGEVQRSRDPEEKQRDGVPGEREQGGDCSPGEVQRSGDPGPPAISPEPSTVAEVQGLSEGAGQAAGRAAWPSPRQREQSQGLPRLSSPRPEALSLDLSPARAEPPGARTSPQQGAVGDSAPGLPHRSAKGNRRRRKWGGSGCPTSVDWKEPGSPGAGVDDSPAGTKEVGIPAGTGLPVVPTPGEGGVPPSTKEEGSPSGTKQPVATTPGEASVLLNSTEGGNASGTGLPIARTPGEGAIPPSRMEPDSPSGTRLSIAPTPGEGAIPPSSTEPDSPSGTRLSVAPTPGERAIPPSSTEPDSPSGTRLSVAPTPGEGAIPPSPEEETCSDCPGLGALTAALAEAAVPTGAEEQVAPESLERTEAVGAGAAPFVESALPLTGGARTSCPVESLPPTSASVGQDVDWELLRSGIFQLTGGVDRMGRALLTVTPQPPGEPAPAQGELSQALRYLHSLLRKEQQELGLTVLLDLRQGGALPPQPPALLPALQELQEASPAPVSRLLVLAPPEGEELPLIQEALVLSPGDLPQFVDPEQLQMTLGGTLQHSQTQWVKMCQALERLCGLCQGVIQSVQVASAELEALELAESDEALSVQISGHKDAMQKLLSDPWLLELQSSGGSLLARLPPPGTCSAQAARAASLYQEVDDAIHRLVQLSNRRLGQLEQERGCRQLTQAVGWLADHGEQALAGFTPMEMGDSVLVVEEMLMKFDAFHTLAKEWLARGHEALHLAGDRDLAAEGQLLESFERRLESCAHTMHNALRLHRFLQQAQDWALEGVRCLSAIEDSAGPEMVLGTLGRYRQQHGEISDSAFQEMHGLAVQSPWALRELGRCRARCQELGRLLQRRLEVALQSGPQPRRRADSTSASCSPQRPMRGLGTGLGSSRSLSCLLPPPGSLSPGLCEVPSCHSLASSRGPMENSDEEQSPPPISSSTAAFFQAPTLPLGTLPPCQHPAKGPPSTQRALSEPGPPRPSVLIRGLEVSSQEVVDRTCSPREHVMLVRSSAQRAEAPWGGTPSTERKHRLGAQQRLVAELIASEQEYLGCLAELLPQESGCQELPPELKRECGALEGTRDRLLGFHRTYFLKELQGCASHPLRAGGCFLRYADQFSLYALYVKNRQKLDAALASQQAAHKTVHSSLEGPWEDTALANALQRPLEQLERYGRFLEELLQETDMEQVSEREALRAAQQLLESQVQHGRNLLAMEQIRGCELELKAQGQLLHRDEFTVLRGRRKCHRHVFLFEQLLLFSKRKGTEGGLDVYVYKQAYKTADMGLTENIGESGLRFELWFRRRKLREAYTLQASSPEVKHKWTSAVAQLLWRQATLSKELRTQEMVSMGIGDKPFVSVQGPSQALLSSLLTGRATRTRASVALSSFSPWVGAPCSPPAATSSPRPGPAPLGLFCDASPVPPAAGRSPGACSLPGHLEEEEWELDVKHIPRASETAAGSGAALALGEPSPRGAESPGGTAPVQRRPRDGHTPPDLATPL
uniref:Uncharacterized protein n=1 Tax=Gopherus agassizii TaxID=38772 RepID=A0A452I294_9SAUR